MFKLNFLYISTYVIPKFQVLHPSYSGICLLSQNTPHTLMYIIPRNEVVVPQKLLNHTGWLHENTNSDHGLKIIFPFSSHWTTWVTWGVWVFVLSFFPPNQPICYFFCVLLYLHFINYLLLVQQNPLYGVASVVQMNSQKYFLVTFPH